MTSFATSLVAGVANFPNRLDGMIVYNVGTGTAKTGATAVAVSPGFYYYENTSSNINGGTWKPLSPSSAAAVNAWALTGNTGTTPATVAASTATTPYAITAGNFAGTTDAQSYTIGTNNIARLTVGAVPENVGGTDFNFVMRVYGKAHFDQGVVTSNSTYPDYVFDKYFAGKSKENDKYSFLTLKDTEKYIRENNHLPGVTSINDLAKENGKYMIDATQLSVQSLEKIEELYLHTIEQQKEIDALKAELAEIKAAISSKHL